MFELGDKVEIYARELDGIEILDKKATGVIVELNKNYNSKYNYNVQVDNIEDLDDKMKKFCSIYTNRIMVAKNEIRKIALTPKDKIKCELLGVM